MSRRAPEVKAPVPDNGFFVAIPSYQRWTTIATKTLAVLRRQEVPAERVYIFVASNEEYDQYYRAIGKEWPNIIVGVLKLWKQRNFISRFFAEGTHVLSLDDDVEELYQCVATGKEDTSVETKLRCLTAGGLEAIASDAKRRMQHSGAHLWSFSVSDNPFYMRLNHVTKANGLCNGFFWGCLNRHSEDLLLKFGDGHEDVERSVRYFQKDGVVLRYRFLCAKTKCKSNRGGLQASMTASQRRGEEDQAAAILVKEFPHLLKLVPESILGLKFLSTRGPLLRSNVLSLTHFKNLALQKRLDVLQGSVWACEDEDRHFRGGVMERCQGDCICLRTWEPRGEGLLLGTSANELYAKMAAEEFHVLWMPEAACKLLGVEMKELPKGLEDLLRPWAAETGSLCRC